MVRQSLGLLGLAALGLATALPAMADITARVNGRVLDGETKAPLAATMTVADHTGHTIRTTTDRKGQFSAIGLEPGSVTVSFAVPGFASQAVSCKVPPGETARFDFRAYTHMTSIRHTSYRCVVEPSTSDRYTIQ
jgi:hypothetical protein